MKLDFNSMTTRQQMAYQMRDKLMTSTEYDIKLGIDRDSEFFKALEQLVADENKTTEQEFDVLEGGMFIEEDSIAEVHTEVVKTVTTTTTTTTEYITRPLRRELGKTTGRIKQRKLTNHFGGYANTQSPNEVTRTKALDLLQNTLPVSNEPRSHTQISEALEGVTYVGKGDHCHEPSKSANAGHQAVHYHSNGTSVLKQEHFEKIAQAIENHAVECGNRNGKRVRQWNELLAQYHASGPVTVTRKQYSSYTSFISDYFYVGDRMELSPYDKDHPQQALKRHEAGRCVYSPKDVRWLKAKIRKDADKQAARVRRYEKNTDFSQNMYNNSIA